MFSGLSTPTTRIVKKFSNLTMLSLKKKQDYELEMDTDREEYFVLLYKLTFKFIFFRSKYLTRDNIVDYEKKPETLMLKYYNHQFYELVVVIVALWLRLKQQCLSTIFVMKL